MTFRSAFVILPLAINDHKTSPGTRLFPRKVVLWCLSPQIPALLPTAASTLSVLIPFPFSQILKKKDHKTTK